MRDTELLGSRVTLAIRAKLTPLGEAATTLSTAKALVTARTGEVTMVVAGKRDMFACCLAGERTASRNIL